MVDDREIDKMVPSEQASLMGEKRRLSCFEKIVAALLCKGDLSEEKLDAEPCATLDLFRFATFPQRVWFSLGLLCALFSGLLMPLNTVYSGMVAKIYLESGDAVHDQHAFDAVMSVIWFYAISAALLFVSSAVQQYLLASTTNDLVGRLRREYLSAVLRADAQILDASSAGKMSSVLNDNIDTIRDGMGEKIALVIRCCGMYLVSIALSMLYNWKVTLCLLPLGPLCAMIMGLMGKYSAKPIKRQMDSAASAAAIVEESIMHVRTVASCNGQADLVKKYSSSLVQGKKLGARAALINGFFEGTFFFCLYAFATVAVIVGVIDAHAERAAKGSVVIAFACVTLSSFYMGTVGPHMMSLLKARISAAVIYRTIDESPPVPVIGEKSPKLSGNIVFDNVRFKYATRDVEVLRGLSITAKSGQCIALAGHSGGGKSTVASLLTKLYSCTEGQITIDDRNIADIDSRKLRQAIGVVSQEPCLFNGTIRENIVLGRKSDGNESEEGRLSRVLRIAHADSFVAKLDKGVDTLLGDGGIALSGGQKQRIAIARALFMDPSILILDEATSALDVQSEGAVQEALNDARSGRTTIVIAHRLSTLKSADVIYVLDQGVVAEQGSHESLIVNGGIYARMVERQSLVSDGSPRENVSSTPLELTETAAENLQKSEVNAKEATHKTKQSSFTRLYTHGFVSQIGMALLFSILRGLEMTFYVVIAAYIYAALEAPSSDYSYPLTMCCVSSIVLGAAVWGFLSGACYFSGLCSESVLAVVRRTIHEKVLNQNASYFDDAKSSNATIVSDLNQQAGSLAAGLDGRMVTFVWCSTSFIACLVSSLLRQWQIGLYGLAVSVIYLVMLIVLFYLITNYMEREAREDHSAAQALEIFAQTRTIQVMAVEQYFEAKYERTQADVCGMRNKVAIVNSVTHALNMSAIFVFGAIAFATGAKFVYEGELSSHSLFIVGISIEFCGCCLSIVNPVFPDLMRANAAARILYSYFDLSNQTEPDADKCELKGDISVQNLHFAYPSRPEHEVIRSLNLSATSGESIALVGPSGCGKSTIIALLERFYEQRAGEILLDGHDHRRIPLSHLRQNIALVGQEPVIFEGTIKDNILLGSQASLEDVRAACRTANAAQFIEALPEGYDTLLSSMGRSLSGGQKQRIAIARALVRNPKILLLDEATSALDGESERVVQEALASASSGRTSLSIAHRLSSIKDANRIFFIENGSVVESGSHEELSKANGKYAAYVKAQSLE